MSETTPHIRAVAAMTLDGRIARTSSNFTDWTSPEDKDFLHAKLDESDVIIVGNNTYEIAREPLSKRNCIVLTRSVKMFEQVSERCVLLNADAVELLPFLSEHNYQLVDVLGGTQVYSWFLQKKLLDELFLTVEPVIFGSGLPLFDCATDDVRACLQSIKTINQQGSVLLHYTFNF